jgi:hypothetical protein
MSPSSPTPARLADAAVLLVLLPPALSSEAPYKAQTNKSLRNLQGRLGPGIRVLQVDEASHPAVVRSFGTPGLPACVLVRQGVELWRHQGLPEDETSVLTLLEAASPCA